MGNKSQILNRTTLLFYFTVGYTVFDRLVPAGTVTLVTKIAVATIQTPILVNNFKPYFHDRLLDGIRNTNSIINSIA